MKRNIFVAFVCLMTLTIYAQAKPQQQSTEPVLPSIPDGYVDLGLPSGTLWKDKNESGYYSYDQAVSQFGSSLPSQGQWEELRSVCVWTWKGNGYKVVGPNGASIFLPAAGFRYCNETVHDIGTYGIYWSSTPDGSEKAWYLRFDSGEVDTYSYDRCFGRSVRLVR